MFRFFRFPICYPFSAAITIIFLSIIINIPLAFSGTETITPEYIGSSACKSCHQKEYTSFISHAKKSRSFESIERVKKGLTEDEVKKCYLCHTTGYGKRGGFISSEKTPHLKNAGCEVCHGPGGIHAKTKNRSDIKKHQTMEDCAVCHTSERVKAFRYKPLIHGGAH